MGNARIPAMLIAMAATAHLPVQAETELHPIITASRIAQTTDETMAPVSVITEEDIQQSQSQSLPQLLREQVPGLDFSTTGGPGHQTSTFLRGTNSDHVLILLDGIIIGSATTGTAALELVPISQIERIEVVRGPRSSLYGSEAIGGVIQIFTKKGRDIKTASASYGTNNTIDVDATLGLTGEHTRFNLSAGHYSTDGFNVTNDSEDDDDGHSSNSVNINIRHAWTTNTDIHAGFIHAEGDTEFDNDTFDNVSDFVQQNITLGINTSTSPHWDMMFDIGQSTDELDTRRNSNDFFNPGNIIFERTFFKTVRDQVRFQNEVLFRQTGQFAFGVDYINDEVESTTDYAETERDNLGAYALVQEKFGRHQLQLAGRIDDNEAFGNHSTGSIAWSYDVRGDLRVNASYGTAFKAPSFNELYFNDPFFSGNPDLEPETSRSTEISLHGERIWGQWNIHVFHTEIENLIVTNASFTSVENAEEVEIDGIEFELDTLLAGWSGSVNLALIDPVNKVTGKVLQNRAKQTLKLSLMRNINRYSFGANLLAQSSRFADSANTIELAGYGIVNLVTDMQIDRHWRATAKIENLFDKEYSTTIDFYGNTTNNTPLSFFAGLSYLH